ncbi:hypothetical protein TRIP_B200460 [uncultured Desulfatiglans sp.]|uniref:Uncharacterized protein n=1 Tax=Uncultured Desulfatiglans sp. TaxID=1748965 RepID=A0A653A2T2_UNCDX|nr:hypothetical protein TRIP_B200460 [uncultured Desulfatiglans sp.]
MTGSVAGWFEGGTLGEDEEFSGKLRDFRDLLAQCLCAGHLPGNRFSTASGPAVLRHSDLRR